MSKYFEYGYSRLLVAAILVLTLFACESMSHEDQGRVIGGVVGGVLGAQVGDGSGKTAAIIVGTLAGSMIGAEIGQNMDERDRRQMAEALESNRTYQATTWVNPDTGREYTVSPTRTYQGGEGPCREFNLLASTDQQPNQTVSGLACLRDDGVWVLQ